MTPRRNDIDLSPPTLLGAYASGAFPMADPESGRVDYYSCDPRCLIPLDERFHVAKSLARVVRSGRFRITFDTAFGATVRACAAPRGEDRSGWIGPELIPAYERLHELGFAHSVEAWRDGRLVGGLYGVSLGGAFFGESMFSRPEDGGRDASKVCLVHLVERLRERGFALLDSQYGNDHIYSFGAQDVAARDYLALLATAIDGPQRW
ncbi:MAG: leucyl/phenylalanyl-tRNA--protein transferase [Phycisphaerales bacterium]